MSSEQVSAVSKKTKKVIEQWADTQDAYVNKLYKKLRNGQKKLNDIQEVEKKLKTKEIQATPELLEKVQRKDKVKAEMDEVLGYLELYKESFPENPAFAAGGAKKAAKKVEAAPVQVVAPVVVEPAVDVSKVVEDALALVADAVIFGYLNLQTPLSGTNGNISDSLHHLNQVWAGLGHGVGNWSSAKGNFVDTFSRLVLKSSTQVGSHTSKSFSEIHAFLTNVASTEGEALLAKTRSTEDVHHHAGHHHHGHHHGHKHHEEEVKGVAGTSSEEHTTEAAAHTTETAAGEGHHHEHHHKHHHHHHHKEGEEQNQEGEFRGNRRGGRGGYRGNNFYRKHNQDEEGFQVVKPDEAHHNHYNSRRQQRGGFRGGRGGQRGGEGGADNNTPYRGGRGGFRGEGRPWTAKEHKNVGEVRKVDLEHPAGEETGPKGTDATTTAQ